MLTLSFPSFFSVSVFSYHSCMNDQESQLNLTSWRVNVKLQLFISKKSSKFWATENESLQLNSSVCT